MSSLPARLHLSPAVIELAISMEYIPAAVAGMVRAAWEYFEEQIPSGSGVMPKAVLDNYIDSDGFAAALEAAGMAAWDGDEVVITWAAPKLAAAQQADPQPSKRDRDRSRQRAYRARTKAATDNVTPCHTVTSVTSVTNGPDDSKNAGHCHTLSHFDPGTEFALKPASLNTKDRSEGESANDRAGQPRSLIDHRARLLRILVGGGIPQDQAILMLASPQGTHERITWAIETLAKRCKDARARGRPINRPDKYLETLLLKADNGPGAPAQRPIGGDQPLTQQQKRLKQLAALKSARAGQ